MLTLLTTTGGTATTGTTGSIWITVAYLAVFIGIMYFFLIRPQKKQQKEMEKMQSSIQNGDWILLNNGMYGKVVNFVNNCVIVEFGTNKSIMIPVLRNQIAAKGEPDLTAHTVDESAVAPTNPVVENDVEASLTKGSAATDGLDDYDRYILEQGSKKKKNKK